MGFQRTAPTAPSNKMVAALSLDAEMWDSDCMSPTDRLVSPTSLEVDMMHRKFQRGAKIFEGEPLPSNAASATRCSTPTTAAASAAPPLRSCTSVAELHISLDADPVDGGLVSPTDMTLSPTSAALETMHGKAQRFRAAQHKENYAIQGRAAAPLVVQLPLRRERRASPLNGG